MKADEHGFLLHTYYGAPVDDSDFSYLIVPDDHGFSGQPGELALERTYSLDFYPVEYPVHGVADFRIPALMAGKKGGVPALDLRYHSHEIRSGKYSLPGLPALFAGEEDTDVQTLEITLKDAYEEIYVKLLYGVYEKANVITRAVTVENHCAVPVELKRVMSMSLELPDTDLDMIHFYGKHTGERQFERRNLLHGITEISSRRGNSSHQHNPFVILCEKETSEQAGGCYGISFVYSGSFRMQAERDQFDSLRFVCGLSDEEFVWTLQPGESFTAPEVVLTYTPDGISDLTRGLNRAYQNHLIRSPWKNKRRPILVNNWEATYFDFNAEKLLKIAREAAELGLDMLVLDDGWFGKRDDDNSGLGDWKVNEKKLGCSLRNLAEQIHGLGLKFGIWVEPEMVSEDSDLYRAHPDWALTIPGRLPNHSRNQLALDMSNPEVVDYLKRSLDEVLSSADIEYVKWDINSNLENVYSAAHPELSQGAVRHLCVLGTYELKEYLVTRYPHILLEGCNGGGGRFDAGMLYYAPQIWCSDNTDAIERLRIHYGTSFGYPMSSVSAHVSVCPNHQNGRVVPFRTRGICAMQGTFGYELDLSKMTEEEKAEAKQQIAVYRENYDLFRQGDYYRIASPFENHDFTAWSYVSEDRSRAMLGVVYTDLHGNPKPNRIRWQGLQADALYEIEPLPETLSAAARCQGLAEHTRYTGAALMHGGMVLPKPQENYDSCMVMIRRV